jgi:hypothetical protein
MKSTRRLATTLGAAASSLLISSCEVDTQFSQVTALLEDDSNPVCDPFEGGQISSGQGLWARLKYLPESAPRYEHVQDYMTHGVDPGVDIYFNQLFTATRPFDRGFIRQDGSPIQTEAGNLLYEYFGLHFESKVKLAAGDLPGRYQFAVISDDGSILRVKENGSFSTLINNDMVTPSRMACASSMISMDSNSRLPIEVDYFQGPRFHISLILLWRHIPDSEGPSPDLSDWLCGNSGNDLFFDSTQSPPAPSQHWINLLGRGWKVLTPANFELHPEHRRDACQDGGPIGT